VQPKSFASYENVEILRFLAQYYDLNTKDKNGTTPLDLAN